MLPTKLFNSLRHIYGIPYNSVVDAFGGTDVADHYNAGVKTDTYSNRRLAICNQTLIVVFRTLAISAAFEPLGPHDLLVHQARPRTP